jgi:hypothetical protein
MWYVDFRQMRVPRGQNHNRTGDPLTEMVSLNRFVALAIDLLW